MVFYILGNGRLEMTEYSIDNIGLILTLCPTRKNDLFEREIRPNLPENCQISAFSDSKMLKNVYTVYSYVKIFFLTIR